MNACVAPILPQSLTHMQRARTYTRHGSTRMPAVNAVGSFAIDVRSSRAAPRALIRELLKDSMKLVTRNRKQLRLCLHLSDACHGRCAQRHLVIADRRNHGSRAEERAYSPMYFRAQLTCAEPRRQVSVENTHSSPNSCSPQPSALGCAQHQHATGNSRSTRYDAGERCSANVGGSCMSARA